MEQNLKQRLVGALVLISLAVIFLPLVFDGQQQRIDTAPYAIPEKPAITIVAPDVKPLEAAAREQYQEVADVDVARASQEESSAGFDHASQTSTADVADTTEATAAAKPEAVSQAREYLEAEKQVDSTLQNQPVSQTVPLADAWVIQVGAFGSSANATGLQAKLKAAGYAAFVKSVKASNGTLYKVYVGPEIRRARLDQQKTELERKFKLKALILKYIP